MGMRHKAGMGSNLNPTSPDGESSVSLALGFSPIPAPSKSDSGVLQKQHAARVGMLIWAQPNREPGEDFRRSLQDSSASGRTPVRLHSLLQPRKGGSSRVQHSYRDLYLQKGPASRRGPLQRTNHVSQKDHGRRVIPGLGTSEVGRRLRE
ncbi:hypothetical protein DY000_02058616 [Brassica cretica]|uniref:DUF4005 domain-containing protein n=1 Tax=Brassica cretica TaxID=69181 RepID=A0ABQ7APZ2_BRACR|nr:hypothetical protein DY000_02058616 [Brassica cretica]